MREELTEEEKLIIDFSRRTDENLNVALQVGAVYDRLRNAIISEFLGDVGAELGEHIKSARLTWKLKIDTEFVDKKYHGIWIECVGSPGGNSVGIECEASGASRLLYGIYKTEKAQPQFQEDQLAERMLKMEGIGGGRNQYWEYYRFFGADLSEWGSHTVLMELHDRQRRRRFVVQYSAVLKDLMNVYEELEGMGSPNKRVSDGT